LYYAVLLLLHSMRRRRLLFLSVTLTTKSTKFRSRYRVDRVLEGDEIWHIGSPGLAVHQCQDWWTSAKMFSWGTKIVKGVKEL